MPPCEISTPSPATPCQWSDWSEWGACDKCGGQRKRTRHIDKMPEAGGTPCDIAASEEVGKCDRQCHDAFYCRWSPWKPVAGDSCSRTCGGGSIKMERHLIATKITDTADSESLTSLSDLKGSIATDDDHRTSELFFSFACGGLVTLIGVAFRAMRR